MYPAEMHLLPESLKGLVESELASGERLRWVGRPTPRSTMPWVAWFPVVFSIPWTLFSLFWMAGAAGIFDKAIGGNGFKIPDNGRMIFAMFGIPFVLIGIAMMTSPFWIRRRIRRAVSNTAYVITDRRAIVFDGGFFGESGPGAMIACSLPISAKGINIRSYAPNELGQIQRIQREDGSGDVIFGETTVSFAQNTMTGDRNTPIQMTRSGFLSIAEVKHVEELLKSLVEHFKKPDA